MHCTYSVLYSVLLRNDHFRYKTFAVVYFGCVWWTGCLHINHGGILISVLIKPVKFYVLYNLWILNRQLCEVWPSLTATVRNDKMVLFNLHISCDKKCIILTCHLSHSFLYSQVHFQFMKGEWPVCTQCVQLSGVQPITLHSNRWRYVCNRNWKDLLWNFVHGSHASWKVLEFFLNFPGPGTSRKMSVVPESPGN